MTTVVMCCTQNKGLTICFREDPPDFEKTAQFRLTPFRSWSTAAAHCLEDPLDGRLDLREWQGLFSGERWRDALRIGVEEEALEERIREATRRGCPLGSAAFVERIGRALGRDLRPRPPGRPPKQAATKLSAMG